MRQKREIDHQLIPVVVAQGATRGEELPFIYFASNDPPPQRRTIRGQRRRPGSDRPSSGQAQAPRRDNRPSGGSSLPPVSGGGGYYPPSGGSPRPMGGFPGGTRGAAGGGGILLTICAIIAYFLFGGGGGDGGDVFDTSQFPAEESGQSAEVSDLGSLLGGTEEANTGASLPPVTSGQSSTFQGAGGLTGAATSGEVTGAAAASLPSAAASSVTDGQTWTILLYQDADDKVLEQDIFIDFNEAERVGSTDRVRIVAQLDRYQGGFNGDGNWTDTRRFLVQQDNDLNTISSPFESIGEADMSDPQTLVEFVTWGIQEFPADKYVLILSLIHI